MSPTDNPLKKDECEANLKMFETLATLQVGILGVSNYFWFTVVIVPVLLIWILLKIICINNFCAKVVFFFFQIDSVASVDFKEIL